MDALSLKNIGEPLTVDQELQWLVHGMKAGSRVAGVRLRVLNEDLWKQTLSTIRRSHHRMGGSSTHQEPHEFQCHEADSTLPNFAILTAMSFGKAGVMSALWRFSSSSSEDSTIETEDDAPDPVGCGST